MRSDIWIIHRLKPSACLICCPRVFKRFRDRYNCGGRARSTHFANVQKLLPTTGRVEHARPLQRASSRNRLCTATSTMYASLQRASSRNRLRTQKLTAPPLTADLEYTVRELKRRFRLKSVR